MSAPPTIKPRTGAARAGWAALRGFAAMPMADRLAIAPAWVLIGVAAGALRIVPFARLAPLLGRPLGAVACVALADGAGHSRARLVRRAIRRAARLAPFRSDCLPQVFAGAWLCRLLGVPTTAHLGVRLEDGTDMQAHAWLCAGRIAVTGGYSFSEYAAVACFAAHPGRAR